VGDIAIQYYDDSLTEEIIKQEAENKSKEIR